jgi:hypothetical protein
MRRNSKVNVRRTKPMRNRNKKIKISVPKNTSVLSGDTMSTVLRTQRDVIRIPLNRFITESVIVDLTYPDTVYTRSNAGFTYLSWRYRVNSIYDPDPLVGTGPVPGFSFWQNAFKLYRVLKIGYSIDLSNLESAPVDVIAVPTNNDIGANFVAINEMFGNPFASQALLSSAGGMDRARLKGSLDLGEFWGSVPQYLGDPGFASATTTNPANLLFLNIGGSSASNFTALKGLDYRVTLVYTTLFSNRINVTS